MNEGFVHFEVNRYLGWPGQAPSYKVGQRIWEQLRDEVARARGRRRSTSASSTAGRGWRVGLDTLRQRCSRPSKRGSAIAPALPIGV